MQTITARPLFPPHPAAPALVSAEHVHDLISDLRRAHADRKAAVVRAEAFRTANIRLLEAIDSAAKPVGTLALPGGPTVVYSSGALQQFITRAIDTPDGFEYVGEWVAIAPLPGSPAAIVAESETEAAALLDETDITYADVLGVCGNPICGLILTDETRCAACGAHQ